MNTFLTVNAWLVALIFSSTMAPKPATESRVYVSQDHGLTWKPGDDGLPDNEGINVLILHNRRVFAGTDRHGVWAMDRNGWYGQSSGLPKASRVISLLSYNQLLFAGLYRGGLYYSADDGNTWHPVGHQQNANVRALSGYAGAVYAGTDDGVYRVDVRGGNWPRLLCGQINAFASNERYVYAGTHLGVVRSNDGVSWETVYEKGAINKLVLNEAEILAMDYAGQVYRAEQGNPFFVKEDLFLPHSYFQLTPASPKILGGEWSDLSFVKSGSRQGLPDNAPLGILLQTPFGLLAVRANGC